MRKYYRLSAVILLSLLGISCEKNGVQEIDKPLTDGAKIKFFNFGVGSPSVNFYANDVKVSATATATGVESTTGVLYGSVFPSNNYSFITAGTYTFKGQISATALVDPNLVVTTLSSPVENGKYYSMYTSGIYNAVTKTADAFIVEDKLPAEDNTASYVRFVNSVSNATSALTLVIKNTNTSAEVVIGTGVSYKSASGFIKIPEGVYDISLRSQGSNINIVTRLSTSLLSGKVYTVSSRGDVNIVAAAAVNRIFLDNTANR